MCQTLELVKKDCMIILFLDLEKDGWIFHEGNLIKLVILIKVKEMRLKNQPPSTLSHLSNPRPFCRDLLIVIPLTKTSSQNRKQTTRLFSDSEHVWRHMLWFTAYVSDFSVMGSLFRFFWPNHWQTFIRGSRNNSLKSPNGSNVSFRRSRVWKDF